MFESIVSFFLMWPVVVIFGILASITYIVAAESDDYAWAVAATIVAMIIYGKTLVVFTMMHWQMAVIIIIAYGIMGGLWSIFRWFKFCRNHVKTHEVPTHWSYTREDYYKTNLDPSNHKSRLISWIAYWPWSMLWNVVGDFFTGIYDALINIYKRTAAAVIGSAMKSKTKDR